MYAILGGRFAGSNHFLATAPMRDDAARNPGKIRDDAIDLQTAGGDQFRHRSLLPLAEFAGEYATRPEQARQFGGDRAIGVKPIDPTVERATRVEIAHLGRQTRNIGGSDIRWIGDYDIEGFSQRLGPVAGDELGSRRE